MNGKKLEDNVPLWYTIISSNIAKEKAPIVQRLFGQVFEEKETSRMNSKVKGILQILLVVVLIAAFAIVAYRGIGSAHRGSAQNIRLGLDLRGGVSVT